MRRRKGGWRDRSSSEFLAGPYLGAQELPGELVIFVLIPLSMGCGSMASIGSPMGLELDILLFRLIDDMHDGR